MGYKQSSEGEKNIHNGDALVCTTLNGTLAVWTISSSPSSLGSLDLTEYLHSPPSINCTRMMTNGGPPNPKGMGSADAYRSRSI